MMDVNEINNNPRWKKILQSPKRIALIIATVVIVSSGLILSEMAAPDVPRIVMHQLNLPNTTYAINDDVMPTVSEPPAPPTWHNATVKKGDTFISLLQANHINRDDIIAVLALPEVKKNFTHLHQDQTIALLESNNHRLLGMRFAIDATNTLNVTRKDDYFIANMIEQPIVKHETITHVAVNGSLYQSAARAKVPHKITQELADIFAWKINFAKDLHAGDSFTVVYDNDYVGDKKIDTGDVVAAEINLQGQVYRAVRFIDKNGNTNYYTPTGQSLKAGFLRAPLHYSRISSTFSPSRMQPILHFRRPHLGVDLAAPRGTAIDAAGDGTVMFVGRDAGYGNLIIIDHGHGVTTRYGHIQRFVKGIHAGEHVTQGQVIAFVGSTGLATGPHLHYEFRINGTAYDPLKVKLPGGAGISSKYRSEFLKQAHELIAEISQANDNALA
jgi:murein DD-endopeptidase MepM/ murein hydrolase activator NlpD